MKKISLLTALIIFTGIFMNLENTYAERISYYYKVKIKARKKVRYYKRYRVRRRGRWIWKRRRVTRYRRVYATIEVVAKSKFQSRFNAKIKAREQGYRFINILSVKRRRPLR